MGQTTFLSPVCITRRTMGALAAAWAATVVLPVHAHDFRVGDLVIDHPYATPALAGANDASAYFKAIRNKGRTADRLVAASTPIAERVELQEMSMEGDTMHMRRVPAIDIAAGQEVVMRHGPNNLHHLMLVNMKSPLKEGDHFELTLKFERAGNYSVNVWVQQPKDVAKGHQH